MAKYYVRTNNVVKKLIKDRKAVVGKCRGEGFSEEEAKFLREKECSCIDGDFCKAYAFPGIKWKLGRCPMSTNYRPDLVEEKQKIRVGQQRNKRKKH